MAKLLHVAGGLLRQRCAGLLAGRQTGLLDVWLDVWNTPVCVWRAGSCHGAWGRSNLEAEDWCVSPGLDRQFGSRGHRNTNMDSWRNAVF
jgi:hypothetical protein